jgi:hypothetical protein
MIGGTIVGRRSLVKDLQREMDFADGVVLDCCSILYTPTGDQFKSHSSDG